MGEKVFFTAASVTFSSGHKLVHGGQGEVVGPATLETHKGKGVAVLFPGNKGNIDCYLTQVRRLRAASAATPPACAPHTRRCPRPYRLPSRTVRVPRRPNPSCKRRRARRSPTPRGREG